MYIYSDQTLYYDLKWNALQLRSVTTRFGWCQRLVTGVIGYLLNGLDKKASKLLGCSGAQWADHRWKL